MNLRNFWHDEQIRVVGLIGWGGVGKSSLARRWYDELSHRNIKPDGFFWWSFYYQPSLDEFLEAILAYLTGRKFQTESLFSLGKNTTIGCSFRGRGIFDCT